MVVYINNPKNVTRNHIYLRNSFSKISGYKISVQKKIKLAKWKKKYGYPLIQSQLCKPRCRFKMLMSHVIHEIECRTTTCLHRKKNLCDKIRNLAWREGHSFGFSSRPGWSTQWVLGEPRLHSKSLFQPPKEITILISSL